MRRLFQDAGSYYSGLFTIHISGKFNGKLDLKNLSVEQLSTFMHEYIHFLQDTSTTRGISYAVFVSKKLQLFFAHAVKCGETIKLPFTDIEKSGGSDAYKECELQTFYFGNCKFKKIHHINRICKEPEEIITEEMGNTVQFHTVKIYYDDDKSYDFGSNAISESMAYLIERELFNTQERENEIPYNLCELVCNEIYPCILSNRNILIAMCELSLMHYDSGVMFWEILQEMKNKKLRFQTVQEFTDYFEKRTVFLYQDYYNGVMEIKECFDFLYPTSSNLFNEVRKQLTEYINTAQRTREDHPLFISELVENKKMISSLDKIFKCFGFPIIYDDGYNIYSTHDLTYLLAPIALCDYFESRTKKGCFLSIFCIAQNNENYSQYICENVPWKQAEKEKLCPFGLYWHIYLSHVKKVMWNQ